VRGRPTSTLRCRSRRSSKAADTLRASGLRPVRVLVEIDDETLDGVTAVRTAGGIDGRLDPAGPPRLHHGMGPGTWAVLEAAAALGHDIRVGLEDVLTLPDGEIAPGNAELVAAAG
jgi:beta-keto acid cleavage enzyme